MRFGSQRHSLQVFCWNVLPFHNRMCRGCSPRQAHIHRLRSLNGCDPHSLYSLRICKKCFLILHCKPTCKYYCLLHSSVIIKFYKNLIAVSFWSLFSHSLPTLHIPSHIPYSYF
uniref:Ovule protein n=1 Tax=Ascaris lumbricoides TaxID=6252 RepID=A0A0M3IQY8_ASCLU